MKLSKGTSLKDIEATTKETSIKTIKALSLPSKDSTHVSRHKSNVPSEDIIPDDVYELSSVSSYSLEKKEKTKPQNPWVVFMAKRTHVGPDLVIVVLNGHTGHNTRQPITDLGEFFQI